MLSTVLAIVSAVLIIGADQYTKYFISANFDYGARAEFLKGFIDIQYIHNSGGAWGILSGNTVLLLSFTVVVMVILVALLVKIGKNSKLFFWSVCLVISGGIGNMIDRIFRGGEVIDFLHFEFYPTFPIFNIADISVVVGAGLLILYFIIDTVKDFKRAKENETN